MSKVRSGIALALLSLTACAGWQNRVVRQASFDHGCDERNVRVVRDSGERFGRTVDLEVCGATHRYRDYGDDDHFFWVDISNGESCPQCYAALRMAWEGRRAARDAAASAALASAAATEATRAHQKPSSPHDATPTQP